ncbi:hypothetical protein ACFLQK_00640 [bacterium]
MTKIDKKLFVETPDEIKAAYDGEYTGVYAGTAFCRQALPAREKLEEMIVAAANCGFSFHLVTPPLTEDYFARALELVETVDEKAPGSEVIVNDFGLLNVVAAEFPGLQPVAGRVLAFQKTDPVVPEILEAAFSGAGPAGRRGAFSHVSANNSLFADFLTGKRVSRMEIQNPLQGVSIGKSRIKYTIHSPYVYVSSTMYCGPAEYYTRPGRVPGVYTCLKHCMSRWYRLKPKGGEHTLFFRGNTIYIKNPVGDPPPEADRLVEHRLPS